MRLGLRLGVDRHRGEAHQNQDRAVDDVAIAQGAAVCGRADDIRVVSHEMAFHLIKQALLLFGEWHASPSTHSDASILRVPWITRLGPCQPLWIPSRLFPSDWTTSSPPNGTRRTVSAPKRPSSSTLRPMRC